MRRRDQPRAEVPNLDDEMKLRRTVQMPSRGCIAVSLVITIVLIVFMYGKHQVHHDNVHGVVKRAVNPTGRVSCDGSVCWDSLGKMMTGASASRLDQLEKVIQRHLTQSDDEVLQTTKDDIKRYVQSAGSTQPTFGLTAGNFSGYNFSRLYSTCGLDLQDAHYPPELLMIPGRLSSRKQMPQVLLCYLWNMERFFSRATGGRLYGMVHRLGDAALDNKAMMAELLTAYAEKNNCPKFRGYPVTVALKDQDVCESFYRDNKAPHRDSIWFMKRVTGSRGTHIKLQRRFEVEAAGAERAYVCPDSSTIASLGVENLWKPEGRKFDHRVYILVASFDPLVILFHRGSVRLVAKSSNVSHSEELDPASEITNLILQDRFTQRNDTSSLFRSHDSLHSKLVQQHGKKLGDEYFLRLSISMRSAAMQVVFSARHRLENFAIRQKKSGVFNFLWLAMDIAIDQKFNAFVLDVNSMPLSSPQFFDRRDHPSWILEDRSSLAREALDIVQEIAFRVLVRRWGGMKNATSLPLTTPEEWELVYHEARGGSKRSLIRPGQCFKMWED